MEKVRVIAQTGGRIPGPAKVKLTKEQHARRVDVLGKASRSGVYEVPGGAVLTFKLGEEIEISDMSKAVRGQFEMTDPPVEVIESGKGQGDDGKGDGDSAGQAA